MKLVMLSDTHGKHLDCPVPDGDVLIHAGDCTDDIGQASLRRFLAWFGALPHKHKLFIAGNHDGAFEKWPTESREMVVKLAPGVTYLQEGAVTIDGVKFYGMPHTPAFCDWYFNVKRELMFVHTSRIPADTDVLITHGPPFSILDISGFDKTHVGCRALYEDMQRVKPQVHVFGHIHHSYGHHAFIHDDGWKTMCVNASICDEGYQPTRKPFVYDICSNLRVN